MTKYIGLLVLVMIAAANNAYRIDNSLVRAYDTLFGARAARLLRPLRAPPAQNSRSPG